MAECKFGEVGENTCRLGALLLNLGSSFLAPLRWVLPASAPHWLLLALVPIGFLAWGIVLATIATRLTIRSSGPSR